MSTSNQTYKETSFDRNKEVFEIVDRVFVNLGIKYYLIGANARDIHLFKIGKTPSRMTFDVDFAIMVPDKVAYDSIIGELLKENMIKTSKPFSLVYEPKNIIVDILPYGEIAQMGSVNFNQRNTEISVLGYEEVSGFIENYETASGMVIPVTPFEGLIILKLMAWNDNDDRQKDLDDISELLGQSFELFTDEIFEVHNDLFDENMEFDETIFAARVIGRKMAPILSKNKMLKKEIISIIQEATASETKASIMEYTLAQNLEKSIEQIKTILSAMLLGIEDKISNN